MSERLRALFFVQTPEQLRELETVLERAEQLQRGPGMHLVSLSPRLSLGLLLEQAQFDFTYYTRFLTDADFQEAARAALQISHSWFADLVGDPQPHSPDLPEAIRLEILQAFEESTLAFRVASRVLERLSPAQILLPDGIDLPFSAALHHVAAAHNVPVRMLGDLSGLPRPVRSAEDATRRNSKGRYRIGVACVTLARLAHNAWVLAGHGLRQLLDPRPVVLGFGGDVDLVNQRELVPAMEGAGGTRPVLVCKGGVDDTSYNRPAHSRTPYLHFVPLSSMVLSRTFVAECRRWYRLFQQRQQDYQGPYSFLFANPRFDPLFRRIFLHLLPHAMAVRADVVGLLRLLRPRLVLTGNDVSYETRSLVLAARRHGVATLGLVHSGLNNMHYRDFQSEQMAVWGSVHQRDFVQILGKRPEQVIAIGNPQYDRYAGGPGSKPAGGAAWRPGVGAACCAPTGSASPALRPARVLAITALPGSRLTYLDLDRHRQTWRELERLPGHGLQVIVKPHPRFDDPDFYRQLRPQVPDWREDRPGFAVAQGVFLEELLGECDIVVVPNSPTTGAVEAMLAFKPVVYLACAYSEVPFITSIAPGCLVVRDIERICPAILDVLGSPELRDSLVSRGQRFLDDLLGPRDGRATERLLDLIRSGAGVEPAPTGTRCAGRGR